MNIYKVLIIDDDVKYISQMTEILRGFGVNIGFSTNAKDALNILSTTAYDVIILDINMPLMDGFTVLKELKNSKTTKLTPVLMSSSDSDTESVLKAIKLGADDYIVKPIDKEILLDKIDSLLAIRKFVLRWGVLPSEGY